MSPCWSGAAPRSVAARRREVSVRYLSDVNLRAVLNVLISRSGGIVEITNAELYDAMLPGDGETERFRIEETTNGLRISLVPTESDDR
jgi:hypothetical protein